MAKDPRYPPNYNQICQMAHQSSGQRCVVCFKKSTHIHHARYGFDSPGVTVFPVCRKCHDNVCHASINWIMSVDRMKSRNTKEFTKWLQDRFLYIYHAHIPLKGKLKYVPKK